MKDFHSTAIGSEGSLEFIKRRPEAFLPQTEYRPQNLGLTLCTSIVSDALLLIDSPITVFKQNRWWFVTADADWLTSPRGEAAEAFFTKAVPFPEGGPNSLRAESFLAAFAETVVIYRETELTIIKGALTEEDRAALDSSKNSRKRRTVAFRL